MELKDLIKKYYDSNSKDEKLDLKNELLKKKAELDLTSAFEIAVLAHFDTYELTGKKTFLDTMLNFVSK